jgi:ribosomal protein S18 acetylase RimI-like enzyme
MIKIKKATEADTDVLALLGRLTWAESHGHYVEDKSDVSKYLNENFSVSKMKQEIKDPKKLFYIIYADDLPVGYGKLIINAINESVASQNCCQLQRIFILNEFIPLKIGKLLLSFLVEQVKALQLDTMWLTVYIKNDRAIRFYEKNEFKNVGNLNFIVNGKAYDNIIFSKTL